MTTSRKTTYALLMAAAMFSVTPLHAAERATEVRNGMERALAKADEGADELRRFVARTQPIYLLSFGDVVRERDARRMTDRRPAALANAADRASPAAPER